MNFDFNAFDSDAALGWFAMKIVAVTGSQR